MDGFSNVKFFFVSIVMLYQFLQEIIVEKKF